MKNPIRPIPLMMIFLLVAVLTSIAGERNLPAFPGAEGFGRYTTGGRGGQVLYVTSLEDTDTPGTLRWAVNQKFPRIVLFQVGGIIELQQTLHISNPDITIAGQTAPGDGICLKNYATNIRTDNVIIRYMRFRLGDERKTEDDGLWGRNQKNILIDHCSMSWTTDECASFYNNENLTFQWCILAESLRNSVHAKGGHGFGAVWGGRGASFHHNLLAHHDSRNPRFAAVPDSYGADEEIVDFRNNVIFNWGGRPAYAGEAGHYNIVNNYFKPGEESRGAGNFCHPSPGREDQGAISGQWGTFFVSGNVLLNKDGTPNTAVIEDNWLGVEPNPREKNKDEIKSDKEFPCAPVKTETAEEAYESVLKYAGASLKRDMTDTRIVDEVRNGKTPVRAFSKFHPEKFPEGTKATRAGMIDTQTDVGAWEEYKNGKSPLDTDGDGMPDEWEKKNGLDSNDSSEGLKYMLSKEYTNVEVYLDQLTEPVTSTTLTTPAIAPVLPGTAKQANNAPKIKADILVAPDGSGDFKTVQEALNASKNRKEPRTKIFVRKGTYVEKLEAPTAETRIALVGEGVGETILTWGDYAALNDMGTFKTWTLLVKNHGFSAENLTLENSADKGQAVALHIDADRTTFKNCSILGYQDTIFTGGHGGDDKYKQYYEHCRIEGTTDFIFGGGIAWFECCDIHSRRGAFITAASTDEKSPFGYVFHRCQLTAPEDMKDRVALGRPWRGHAAVTFIQCEMGAHIDPPGWNDWGHASNHETARYREYQNTGPGAATDKRVPWSRQLSDEEVGEYTIQNVLKHGDQ